MDSRKEALGIDKRTSPRKFGSKDVKTRVVWKGKVSVVAARIPKTLLSGHVSVFP